MLIILGQSTIPQSLIEDLPVISHEVITLVSVIIGLTYTFLVVLAIYANIS
jgi:hypothetical protein